MGFATTFGVLLISCISIVTYQRMLPDWPHGSGSSKAIKGINTRNSTCPTLRFCGNHVPEDYPRLETGYFKLQLGKQTVTCPGCPVCIRGGRYIDQSTGCQWMACPRYGPIAGCANPRFHLHLYNLDGKMCKACNAITCVEDEM